MTCPAEAPAWAPGSVTGPDGLATASIVFSSVLRSLWIDGTGTLLVRSLKRAGHLLCWSQVCWSRVLPPLATLL